MPRTSLWLGWGVLVAILLAGCSLYLALKQSNQSQVTPSPSATSEALIAEPLAVSPASDAAATVGVATVIDDIQTLTQLKAELHSLNDRVAKLEKSLAVKTLPSPLKSTSVAREYIVYLGSGNTTNRDWTVIPGAGVTLDISTYKNIRSVQFEAGLSIISGEAHARLYDRDRQTPFYLSEVSNNTSAGQWVTSPTVSLPTGSRYYTVQLRSSNGEQANLIGARLKIVAD